MLPVRGWDLAIRSVFSPDGPVAARLKAAPFQNWADIAALKRCATRKAGVCARRRELISLLYCFFWLNGVVSDDFSEIVRSSFAPFTITKHQLVCEFF
jgi:hypothetical protein